MEEERPCKSLLGGDRREEAERRERRNVYIFYSVYICLSCLSLYNPHDSLLLSI